MNNSKRPQGLGRQTIAFIGAGNMGEALIRGLLAAKTVTPSQLVAADALVERLEEIEDEFGIRVTTDNSQAAGAADICRGAHASIDDLTTAETILGAVGLTVRVEERFMDAVTALSGSGPAYVFRVTEAMIEAGVAAGLDPAVAHKLAIQTVYGAAKLMHDSGEDPGELRRKVTSPGGTPAAALKVMNDRRLAEIFTTAIVAATERSRELSGH